MMEQVLGLVMALCVVSHGFGGDKVLVSILMLCRDVARAVDEEAGHPVLILAGVLKRYMGREGLGTLEHAFL